MNACLGVVQMSGNCSRFGAVLACLGAIAFLDNSLHYFYYLASIQQSDARFLRGLLEPHRDTIVLLLPSRLYFQAVL